MWLGLWGCGSCCEEWRAETSGLWGDAQKVGVSVGLSGSLFQLCVCGPPTQHMGLPGWEPHFHGNPWASASGLCAEHHGDLSPGEGQKKLPRGCSFLRGPLSPSGLGGLQAMRVGPCAPGREPVSVQDETQVFLPLPGGGGFFTCLGITDLRDGKKPYRSSSSILQFHRWGN